MVFAPEQIAVQPLPYFRFCCFYTRDRRSRVFLVSFVVRNSIKLYVLKKMTVCKRQQSPLTIKRAFSYRSATGSARRTGATCCCFVHKFFIYNREGIFFKRLPECGKNFNPWIKNRFFFHNKISFLLF